MAEMDIKEIIRYLPHRYPFLLVDRVLRWSPGEYLVAAKNVTCNEQFFQGHFPEHPVMPAVLVLESMAQAAGILGLRSLELPTNRKPIYYFVGIDNARFRQPVEPGDQLILDVRLLRMTQKVCKFASEARVGDKLVASANLMGAIRELEP